MHGFATHTDAFVNPPGTSYECRDGYTVVQTPGYREYYYGNMLILNDPPGPEDLDRWLGVWQEELGETEGIKKRVLEWESDQFMDAALREAARARGLEAGSDDVLVAERPPPGAVSDHARRVGGEREWRAVLEMVVAAEGSPRLSYRPCWSGTATGARR